MAGQGRECLGCRSAPAPSFPAGAEVRLPDPRPPVLRHGVCQRWGGERAAPAWLPAGLGPKCGGSEMQGGGTLSRATRSAGGKQLRGQWPARVHTASELVGGMQTEVPRGVQRAVRVQWMSLKGGL